MDISWSPVTDTKIDTGAAQSDEPAAAQFRQDCEDNNDRPQPMSDDQLRDLSGLVDMLRMAK